jgi:hypothetical protein
MLGALLQLEICICIYGNCGLSSVTVMMCDKYRTDRDSTPRFFTVTFQFEWAEKLIWIVSFYTYYQQHNTNTTHIFIPHVNRLTLLWSPLKPTYPITSYGNIIVMFMYYYYYYYCYVCSILGIVFHCAVLCIVCVCICILYYCHRVSTQLQLTNVYHIISYHTISYHIRLLSQERT